MLPCSTDQNIHVKVYSEFTDNTKNIFTNRKSFIQKAYLLIVITVEDHTRNYWLTHLKIAVLDHC
jgi:hypothetical protein